MHESFDVPEEPRPRPNKEEDSRFHDDDEIVPVDDAEPWRIKPPARSKPIRRPPIRRHYYED